MKVFQGTLLLCCCLAISVLCEEETVKHGNTKHKEHKKGKHDSKYDHEAVLGKLNMSVPEPQRLTNRLPVIKIIVTEQVTKAEV